MLKFLADQVTRMVEVQAAANQRSFTKANDWDATSKYKNLKVFGGDQKEWEEFSTKFCSQVAVSLESEF